MWHLLAQEPNASPVEWFQYGAIGGVLVSLLVGWLWPKPPVDKIIEDKERLLEERDQLLEERSKQTDKLISEVAELRREVRSLAERVARDP